MFVFVYLFDLIRKLCCIYFDTTFIKFLCFYVEILLSFVPRILFYIEIPLLIYGLVVLNTVHLLYTCMELPRAVIYGWHQKNFHQTS